MKRFMAIYMGTPAALERAGWDKLDPKAQQEREAAGMKAWNEWGEKYASRIVDQGAPLGKTKRTSREGISDIKNAMTGYVIIEAESHEEAAKMFLKHPHFMIFPGDSVEIMECLPMPEM